LKPNRREFLKKVASATAALPGAIQEADDWRRYAATVLSEPALLACWRLGGSLKPERGAEAGEMRGGEARYVAGPLGERALSLSGGRFVTLGPAPELDAPETTVELFFRITAPDSRVNPCLLAKRASSEKTRFSIHYLGDLSGLAVWNGRDLAQATPPLGPLHTGEWYHLAVTSGAGGLRLYLDGVPCVTTAAGMTFSVERNGLPLQIGASAPDGAEAVSCDFAEVAIYGAALPAQTIARHVDAAGWAARRKGILAERKRREAEQARARRQKLAKRLRDPRLVTPGNPRVYEGENLTAISFGVGGIGAGTIQLNGKAERAVWQIFNNFAYASLPHSFFALRVRAAGGEPIVRALQTSRLGPFPAMPGLRFRGEYPFAWFDFDAPDLPVTVTMEAFSPFIPLRARESAIPCALFTFTLENRTDQEVEVALLAAQQNGVGLEGQGPVLERQARGYGGNRNRVLASSRVTLLRMTADKDPSASHYGDMTLIALDPQASGTADWSGLSALLQDFQANGRLTGPQEAGPSPSGQTLDGALVSTLRLAPRATETTRFALAWHFPNAQHGGEIEGWTHTGNRYAGWWKDSLDVARFLAANVEELTAQTHLFHDTFYASNLPHWLRDRITSQLAVLRSKTCFWAGDDFFGAWEGCAPTSGCCAGNCTHVWHYAQAHARLFPEIARRMRTQIYADQKPDGALPHRLPGFPPAADGLLGDILGAYREHLCSADGAWLAGLWPKVQRAMEFAIRTWDPQEDGMLTGAQWNTLDGALGGSTTWIGSLYLAALSAAERMADLQGDAKAAARYRRIRRTGAQNQDAALFNGEYYVQRRDPEPREDYGDGCEIDQALGEWWANQVGLPAHYPPKHVRSAMAALLKYNFRADFHGVPQMPRKFVAEDDAGMQMIQWPKGARPTPTILYGDEVMTGFEYAAAGTMIQFGMLREGLMVALAVSDRYDGRLRQGLTDAATASWGYSGNPFGDDECGKFYARAMSVWSLLLACQGFLYDGPAGVIGFRPVWKSEDHASFFSSAEGWGLFTQRRRGNSLEAKIEVRYGRLRVREIALAAPFDAASASVRLGTTGLPSSLALEEGQIRIRLATDAVASAGEAVTIRIS